MSEKQKKAIRELTLMLMYLTSWEERDTPGLRAVKKRDLEKYPLVRRCWKGYEHSLLDKLSEEGLINAAGRTYPALGLSRAGSFHTGGNTGGKPGRR